MSSVIAALAEDVHQVLEQLSRATEAVVIADSLLEKKAAEIEARPILREARSKTSMLRAELRRTHDGNTRAHYEKICHDANEKIRLLDTELRQQINPVRAAFQSKVQTAPGCENFLAAGGAAGVEFADSKQVLQAAVSTQQDALLSLRRAERLQHVTEELGHETLLTVQQQTDQMYQVDEELQNLQGNLDRAARDVKIFFRLLAGDRCFLSLVGICIVAIAVLVFVIIYKKRRE